MSINYAPFDDEMIINTEARRAEGIVPIGDYDLNGEPNTKYLSLTVYHNKDRKHYTVSLTRYLMNTPQNNVGICIKRCKPMEDVRTITHIPAPRYSKKTLKELAIKYTYLLDEQPMREWADEIDPS